MEGMVRGHRGCRLKQPSRGDGEWASHQPAFGGWGEEGPWARSRPGGLAKWTRIGFGGFRLRQLCIETHRGWNPYCVALRVTEACKGTTRRPSRRRTGGDASSQVDPPQGGTCAHAQRHGRWGDRSPLRLPERMDGPEPLAFVRPPAAPREVRLNGFPEALAEVLRHRVGSCGRRDRDAAPTGVSDATKFGEQPTFVIQWGWRGMASAPPSIPPETSAPAAFAVGKSARLPLGRPSIRPVAGCSPADPRSSPVEAVDFAGESAS